MPRLEKFKLFFLFLLFVCASKTVAQVQLPPIGIVDVYGLRTRAIEQDILKAARIKKEDDALKTLESMDEIIKRIKTLPGVAEASLNVVCCDDAAQKTIVFIGVREKGDGSPDLKLRPAPRAKIDLPAAILQSGKDFLKAFSQAILYGDKGEDHSEGHALYNDREIRAVQEKFIEYAAHDTKLLRRVLRESENRESRALATQIIAYAPHKKEIIPDLIYAMTDSYETVRNNAMRALGVLADYAQNNPSQGMKIPVAPFVEMLNSLEWTDRNKSLMVLYFLTAKRDSRILMEIKRSVLEKNALPSLVEMARWKNPSHAQTSFFILGRIANLAEAEIQSSWDKNNREKLIGKAVANFKRG